MWNSSKSPATHSEETQRPCYIKPNNTRRQIPVHSNDHKPTPIRQWDKTTGEQTQYVSAVYPCLNNNQGRSFEKHFGQKKKGLTEGKAISLKLEQPWTEEGLLHHHLSATYNVILIFPPRLLISYIHGTDNSHVTFMWQRGLEKLRSLKRSGTQRINRIYEASWMSNDVSSESCLVVRTPVLISLFLPQICKIHVYSLFCFLLTRVSMLTETMLTYWCLACIMFTMFTILAC